MSSTVQPFDELARDYDAEFSRTVLGGLLRSRTQDEMLRLFKPGDHLLEINCGTGEDAAFLAQRGIGITATDSSAEMIESARRKIGRLALQDRVEIKHCRFDDLDSVLGDHRRFDGLISNFGGLNCSTHLETLAASLSLRVKAGGYLFLCIMGRFVPWEWFDLGCRGKFARVWQRLRGKTFWRGMEISYFTPGTVIDCFSPYCDPTRVNGLGFLLPPTCAKFLVSRHPGLLHILNHWEKRLESLPFIPCLSDHFMLVLKKK
ncbi:MAG: hypothetical protein A3I78_08165 [Gammaproteobacteria bacterium RIFCSPLOWO2_02_FULL_56_15]|nr:MAG: hypothetical protein A3I78_08165 [Gammaproteobacteria bacterium RIFCSPLOWO2_02_FULL_56_15]